MGGAGFAGAGGKIAMSDSQLNQQILTTVTDELRERLRKAYSITVFIGAGVSASSGIPVFRGQNQMKYFEGYPPAYICSTEMLQRSPTIFWQFFKYYYQ